MSRRMSGDPIRESIFKYLSLSFLYVWVCFLVLVFCSSRVLAQRDDYERPSNPVVKKTPPAAQTRSRVERLKDPVVRHRKRAKAKPPAHNTASKLPLPTPRQKPGGTEVAESSVAKTTGKPGPEPSQDKGRPAAEAAPATAVVEPERPTLSGIADVAEEIEDAIELGNHARSENRLEEAKGFYEKALKFNQDEARAYQGIGNVYYEMGEYKLKAQNLLQEAMVFYRKALEAYERAIKLDPRDAEAFSNMSQIYHRMNQNELAESSARKALELDDKLSSAHRRLGSTLFRKGQYPEAIEQFQLAIKLDEDDVLARTGLAAVYYKQKKFKEATEQYKYVVEIDPVSAEGHFNLGLAYSYQDRYQEAIEQFELVKAIDRDYALAYFHLGIAHLKFNNNKSAALDQYQSLKTLNAKLADELLTEINKARR